MITEEEISHQNNNIFDLSHPTLQREEDSALTENKDSKESFNIHSRNWTFFEDLDFPSK